MTAFRNKHLHANKEQSFISTGFSNWKDASKKFNKHQDSHCHKEAVLKTTATMNMSEILSSGLAKEHLEQGQCFLKVLSSVCFLSRQGLALRRDGDESDSNFMQLITLRSEDDKRIKNG